MKKTILICSLLLSSIAYADCYSDAERVYGEGQGSLYCDGVNEACYSKKVILYGLPIAASMCKGNRTKSVSNSINGEDGATSISTSTSAIKATDGRIKIKDNCVSLCSIDFNGNDCPVIAPLAVMRSRSRACAKKKAEQQCRDLDARLDQVLDLHSDCDSDGGLISTGQKIYRCETDIIAKCKAFE